MTHVVIRCDASAASGIGHLVRAISVADAARGAGYSVVVAGTIDSPLAERLLAEARLERIDAPEDLEVLASEQGATIVHLDDYEIGTDALDTVRSCGALLSSMEDGSFGRRPADVVVDSTIRAEINHRPDDGSGLILLGISYAPMRAEVRAIRERRTSEMRDLSRGARILIVMGGTDATGAAGTLAAVCTAADGVRRVSVIAPEHSWDAVRAEAGDKIDLLPPSPEFLEHASAADLVVSAAGTTSWELACIGVPSLLVAVTENQRGGYETALAERIAHGLGSLESIRADPSAATAGVERAIADLRSARSSNTMARNKVDGHGAERIIAAWEEVLTRRANPGNAEVIARPAALKDSSLMLRWRNDPQTRKVSRSSESISWDNHTRWYERALGDQARELYIVERGGAPVGTVRFDARSDSVVPNVDTTARLPEEWEVSITLAPEVRGHGLSLAVLTAGEKAFALHHPNAAIVAAILPDNQPSQRLFARAGYAFDPDRDDGGFDALVKRDPS